MVKESSFVSNDIDVMVSAVQRSAGTKECEGVDGTEARKRRFARLASAEEICAVEVGAWTAILEQFEENLSSLSAYREFGSFGSNPPEPEQFHPKIDVNGLAVVLHKMQEEVLRDIELFKRKAPNTASVKKFFGKCQDNFGVIDKVFGNIIVAEALKRGGGESVDRSKYCVEVSIQRVFETRSSLVVLGEAGAGKTTSLQMYALHLSESEQLREDWMFIPLGRMVAAYRRNGHEEKLTVLEHIENAICGFLNTISCDIKPDSLRNWLTKEPRILLFDGVDEASRSAPWIVESIAALAEAYSKTQIVVSSRVSGRNVTEILPFVALLLMPFNDKQQEAFVVAKCGSSDPEPARMVMQHLRRNIVIRDVVRNPLLATVICEIAMSGMDLPLSELRLYDDRMDLLTGVLDSYKQVPTRIVSRRDDLIMVARKLAYWLHTEGRREDDREVLYQMASDRCHPMLTARAARVAVDELIDVCEVLVPMALDGKVGFGHLRYQEYLVAREMTTQQWSVICEYLVSPWWHDAFVLFAQCCGDMCGFLKTAVDLGMAPKAKKTIAAMIATRSGEYRSAMTEILKVRRIGSMPIEEIDELVAAECAQYNDLGGE